MWSTFQGLHTESILLDTPANFTLDWKSLPGGNTLTYFDGSKITAVTRFVTLVPGLTRKCHTNLENHAVDKHSSLFCRDVSDEEKRSIRLTP